MDVRGLNATFRFPEEGVAPELHRRGICMLQFISQRAWHRLAATPVTMLTVRS